MTNRDIASEVDALRKEVEALMARQTETVEASPEEHDSGAAESRVHDELQHLREKVMAFAELLKDEAREIPAASAVAIFALGVLMGRLLPR